MHMSELVVFIIFAKLLSVLDGDLGGVRGDSGGCSELSGERVREYERII